MKEDGLQASQSWRFLLQILPCSHLMFLLNPCLTKKEKKIDFYNKMYTMANANQKLVWKPTTLSAYLQIGIVSIVIMLNFFFFK